MKQQHHIKKSLKGAIGPTLAALFVMATIGYAIFGPTGLYAWGEYRQSVERQRLVLNELKARQAELKNRVRLLDRDRVDPDLADEYIRKELGVLHQDEIVIPLTDTPAS